jgi:hypothetical protein
VEILPGPPWIVLGREDGPARIRLSDVEAVFIRKDPPFDRAYFYGGRLVPDGAALHVDGRRTTATYHAGRGTRPALVPRFPASGGGAARPTTSAPS